MSSSKLRQFGCVLSVALVTAIASPGESRADVLEPSQRVGDITVYVGVMPSQIVSGHPAGHPEASMHGGVPRGSQSKHIVVALFDSAGNRIENVSVTAVISGPGHVDVQRVRLEPMRIAKTITYGGFITVSDRERETIVIEVSNGAKAQPLYATFTYVPESGL